MEIKPGRIRVDSTLANGHALAETVLPDLNPSTRSFPFKESRELLYSTQFAQPALTLLGKSTLEDMRAKGLI